MRSPKVTFVIATYNADKFLGACLTSIRDQTYPKASMETLIVDGGSEDRTLEIARAYRTAVLPNPRKVAEFGKATGIQKSNADYIVIMDADNELSHEDWLARQVSAMESNPSLIGMDPIYLPKDRDFWINRYCARLQLEDPFIRYLALLKRNALFTLGFGCRVYHVHTEKYPIFGSNGFLWRASTLKDILGNRDRYDEADVAARAMEGGLRDIGVIPEIGVYHHHVRSLREFIGKRLRRGREFLNRRQTQSTWTEKYSKKEMYRAALLCGSFIHPSIEAYHEWKKNHDWVWALHPFICFVTIASYAWVALTFSLFRKKESNLPKSPCTYDTNPTSSV